MNFFDLLDNSTILEIFSYLDFSKMKIPDLQFVSKRFFTLCQHPSLYKELKVDHQVDPIWLYRTLDKRRLLRTLTLVEYCRNDDDSDEYSDDEDNNNEEENCSEELTSQKTLESWAWQGSKDPTSKEPGSKDPLTKEPFSCLYLRFDTFQEAHAFMENEEEEESGKSIKLQCFKTIGNFTDNQANCLANLTKIDLIIKDIGLVDMPEKDLMLNLTHERELVNITKCCSKLREFSLQEDGSISDEAYDRFFEKFKTTLHKLELFQYKTIKGLRAGILESMGKQCKVLEELTLSTKCGDLELHGLSDLPKLTSLVIVSTMNDISPFYGKFLDKWFKGKNFSNLESLTIEWECLTNYPLMTDIAKNCPNLKMLDLCGTFKCGEESFKELVQCENLKELRVGRIQDLTQKSLVHIIRNSNSLKMIEIDQNFCYFSEEEIKNFKEEAKMKDVLIEIMDF